MEDLYIIRTKLESIKKELIIPKNRQAIQTKDFNPTLERIRNLIRLGFGEDAIYLKQLDDFEQTILSLVMAKDLNNLKTIIDTIIDELDIQINVPNVKQTDDKRTPIGFKRQD